MKEGFYSELMLEDRIRNLTEQLKELNRMADEKRDIYETVAMARKQLASDSVIQSRNLKQMDDQLEQDEKMLRQFNEEIIELSSELVNLLGRKQRLEEILITLPAKEKQLFRLVAEGRSISYIAGVLSLSSGYVQNLKKSVLEKVRTKMENE